MHQCTLRCPVACLTTSAPGSTPFDFVIQEPSCPATSHWSSGTLMQSWLGRLGRSSGCQQLAAWGLCLSPLSLQATLQPATTISGASSACSYSGPAASGLEVPLEPGPFEVAQIPGQGRGLVATELLQYGTRLLLEEPFLCCPSEDKKHIVCHHCLKTLELGSAIVADTHTHGSAAAPGRRQQDAFCDSRCLSAALRDYYGLESRLDLSELHAYVTLYGEKFPLLATRLACKVLQQGLQQQEQQQQQQQPSGSSRGGGSSKGSSSSSSSSPQLLSKLRVLCHAAVPPPAPAPWQDSFGLLRTALYHFLDHDAPKDIGAALEPLVKQLNIDWYVSVMSRLHINVFRVDCITPFNIQDMALAAAHSLSPQGSTGSAIYITASMLNHSCDPNLHVTFPRGNATAAFTAARDIAAGEQLTISYMDNEQDVAARQQFLSFAYGFQCECPRCLEEVD